MKQEKYVVLDFETTGLVAGDDEILQVAIINQDNEVLLNEYCKPVRKDKWYNAQRIHGIGVSDVADKEVFDYYHQKMVAIFDEYDYIVCYNVRFERKFLKAYGFVVEQYRFEDPMVMFASIYGEPGLFGNFRWQKLETCANYYGFDFVGHDALQDVKATRYCFERMLEGSNLIEEVLA